jgi:hypothetical protein
MRTSEKGIFGFHERLAILGVVQHEQSQFHSGPRSEYFGTTIDTTAERHERQFKAAKTVSVILLLCVPWQWLANNEVLRQA